MRIECALLCEAATVREGLLNVLGGGITTVVREAYPAALNVSFALRLMLDGTDGTKRHHLELTLVTRGHDFVHSALGFDFEHDEVEGDKVEARSLAVVLPVAAFALPQPDAYDLHLAVDQRDLIVVAFEAKTPSQVLNQSSAR